MNSKFFLAIPVALALALLPRRRDTAQKPAAGNAAAKSASTNSTAADTNGAPKEVAIPLSTFAWTADSRDPFYPNSTRLSATTSTNSSAPVFNISAFTLKALSGPAGKRLAMINNRTLAAGERAEITTGSGKTVVYCDEIRETSVMIHTDNEPQPVEIFLRKGAR